MTWKRFYNTADWHTAKCDASTEFPTVRICDRLEGAWERNKQVGHIDIVSRQHILKLKCTKFDFGWDSAPPDLLPGFQGSILLREREGRGYKRGKGRWGYHRYWSILTQLTNRIWSVPEKHAAFVVPLFHGFVVISFPCVSDLCISLLGHSVDI